MIFILPLIICLGDKELYLYFKIKKKKKKKSKSFKLIIHLSPSYQKD